MTTNRLKHILGILGALALALVPVWGAVDVPLAGKIAVSITVAISVVFSLQKRAEVANLLLGAIGIIGPIITIWLARVPQGTSAAIIGGTVLAVISNLRTALGKQAAAADVGDVPGRVVPIVDQPDTTPRDPAKGGTVAASLLALGLVAALGLLLLASTAHAQQTAEPRLGTCNATGSLCMGPAAAVPVLALNLKTGHALGGIGAVPLGACYGITTGRGTAASVGLDGCLNLVFGEGAPTQIMPSLMAHVSDWGHIGVGALGREGSAGMYWQAVLLVGARLGL